MFIGFHEIKTVENGLNFKMKKKLVLNCLLTGSETIEESLVVVIFNCTLKNIKKANKTPIISKTTICKRSKLFPYCQVIQYQVIHLRFFLNFIVNSGFTKIL